MAKILIVDDDQQIARQIAAELVNHGHLCAIQPRGAGVVEGVRKAKPDLIILDVMLPDVSGFQVCRAIRADDELYTLPILLLSAMNNPEELRHGLAQGADDFVPKPFMMADLLRRVDLLLRQKHMLNDRDPVTELPGDSAIRRELQRRVSRTQPFDVAYAELTNLMHLRKTAGAEAREKAMRHLGRAIWQCGEPQRDRGFFAAHMGGGAFLCLLPAGKAEAFAKTVCDAWKQHVPEFYRAIGRSEDAKKAAGAKTPVHPVGVVCCVMKREENESITPQEILANLSNMRRTRAARSDAGVYVDRRG
ncbi:MAG: response regulator [Candidatus Hydrogenedentales bacterium]